MTFELDAKTKVLVEAAVARGDYPDEATAIAEAVELVLQTDFKAAEVDVELGRAEIAAGESVSFELVRADLQARMDRLSRT